MAVARPSASFAGRSNRSPASAALAVVAVALAVYAYRRRFPHGRRLRQEPARSFAPQSSCLVNGRTSDRRLAILCGTGPLPPAAAAPIAGGPASLRALVIAYHNALPQIWHGSSWRIRVFSGRTTAVSNVHRAVTFVDPRIPFGCLVIAGALASIIVAVRGNDRRLLAALWLWAVAGYAFILASTR